MEQVYGNASLTLVAARSADARVGFITPKTEPEQQHCPLPLSSSTSEVLYFSPYRHQTIGPTSTRGWCYQEEVLSKRMVIFAQHQIAYYCRTWSSWEDGSCTTWNSPIAGVTGAFPSDATDLKVRREKTLVLWYTKVQAYTLRNLSNPHDVFAAIASIAKLAQEVLDSRYLAGLWESDIARGLLWKPKHHIVNGFWPVIRPRSRTYAPSPVTRAPSWSWASIEGPVFHQHAIRKGSSRLNVSIKLRPGAENNRWTADENCDVKELHIPHRELSLIGKISKAFVLDTPARDYLCDKEGSWWKKYGIQKAIKFGVLLGDAEFMNGDKYMLNDDNRDLDEKVVAIGMFDVAEEATKAVWCLRVIEREGLMLIKQGDQWSRVGTFLFERVSFFDGKDDRHIRLI
ncbi:heterokaryon incompatibility protein [Colletotrichum kahawae]|uniref:Heterokaryon incompatibility protein n=1 Tax=Colletotrichum kahawae TaxID=34407 RepID=A0AAD9Y241_COLKA|nr:heterokaryon incompatibility protein [Colletotrichum kahawae]